MLAYFVLAPQREHQPPPAAVAAVLAKINPLPGAERSCPLATGIVTLRPKSDAFTWAGMSSGPSHVCRYGKSSGAIAENDDSRSAGTSGSAFSLIVSDADVCWMNTCSSPTSNWASSGKAATTSRVIEIETRGLGRRARSCVGSRAFETLLRVVRERCSSPDYQIR